jgi:hypothetical protein
VFALIFISWFLLSATLVLLLGRLTNNSPNAIIVAYNKESEFMNLKVLHNECEETEQVIQQLIANRSSITTANSSKIFLFSHVLLDIDGLKTGSHLSLLHA